MSFGWSVGDIAKAIGLLHKVGQALKDSGGASSDFQETITFLRNLSTTVQHISVFQIFGNDPGLVANLKGHCDLLRVSLNAFLSEIEPRFGDALGHDTKWYAVQTASKKARWALFVSKKAKEFRDKHQGSLTAIAANMAQQTLQKVAAVSSEVEEKVALTIDTRLDIILGTFKASIQDQRIALEASHSNSTALITNRISESSLESTRELRKLAISIRNLEEMQLGYQSTLDAVLADTELLVDLHSSPITMHEQTTAITRPQFYRTDATVLASQPNEFSNISSPITKPSGSVDKSIDDTHTKELWREAEPEETSTRKLQIAARDLGVSTWQTFLLLQNLVHEVILLLLPYLIVFYRNRIYPLLLFGDHFKFEDALGRTSQLACLEFQQWELFNRFLKDSFLGSPGLSYVLKQKFQIMNGYNSIPISKQTWATAIQPKCRITMAMLIDSAAIQPGRCADPTCRGRLVLTKEVWYKACPMCGKHMYGFNVSWTSLLRDSHGQSLEIGPRDDETDEVDIGDGDQESAVNVAQTDYMSKFKRLAWRADSSAKTQDENIPLPVDKSPPPEVAVCRTDGCTERLLSGNLYCVEHVLSSANNVMGEEPDEEKEKELRFREEEHAEQGFNSELKRLEEARRNLKPWDLHRGMWEGKTFIKERRNAIFYDLPESSVLFRELAKLDPSAARERFYD